MITAELNYDIYDKELLVIHEVFKQWRAYLEGAQYEIQVFSNHNNLQYFTTTKQLGRRQARWAEYLSSFDYVIHYRAGRLGAKPDTLTRRPDVYPKKSEQPTTNTINNKVAILPELLRTAVILNEEALISQIRHAPHDVYFSKKLQDVLQGHDKTVSLSTDSLLLL